jgi:transcriptional regulator with XRE-family HTH domain
MTSAARTDLSKRLLRLRVQHDPPLNQQQAAELVGLSLRQYGRLERGEATASLQTVARIAAAYGVAPRLLLDRDPDPGDGVVASPSAADFARLEAKIDRLLEQLEPVAAGGRDHASERPRSPRPRSARRA